MVNFSPIAHRPRILGTDETNLRADVDYGKVTTDKLLALPNLAP